MQAAYEHNGRPVSREVFYAIACDPARSVAVEACAGAGKTWMLVSRMLRALLDGSAPHEILAITFTKKAAGEMRQRLQEWLEQFAHAAPEDLEKELVARGIGVEAARGKREQLRNLYRQLLASGRPLQIRTFHSWFAALLSTAPLALLQERGLPTHYELLEDDAQAKAEVWRPYLEAVAGDDALRADYEAVVAAHGRSQTHKALEAALDKRVEFLLSDEAGIVDASVPPFGEVHERLAGVEHPGDWLLRRAAGRDMLEDAARALMPLAPSFAAKGHELMAALQAGDWSGVLAALFTKDGEGTPRAFGKSRPEAVTAAQDEAQTLRDACRQHAAWLHQQRLSRLSRRLIECFGAVKRAHGWVDMNDVERTALTLLSDPVLSGWVQERLDARVRHLLVDEFQDTNPLQWQALHAWLAGYAGAGGGQRPPSVFIVGDPKQSIYRFRRADPQVFAAAQDFIVQALGGERLATDHTRRNAPAVLGAVNTVMQQAQDAGQISGFRRHSTQSDDSGQMAALPAIPRPPASPKGSAAKAP
ncbi:MAG: UvrD-helicase domain-containing protein, partial [Burkholderiales bacterium]|nr:UvrD-helicase domain-containing protein [Burkholderiales bacterium]